MGRPKMTKAEIDMHNKRKADGYLPLFFSVKSSNFNIDKKYYKWDSSESITSSGPDQHVWGTTVRDTYVLRKKFENVKIDFDTIVYHK
jgi:hypothetical protein